MTTGVLPFTPSLKWFTYILIVLVALLVATLVVLFKWHSLTKPVVGLVEYVRKPTANDNEQPAGNEVRSDVSALPLYSNWRICPWILRRGDIRTQEDLEGGGIKMVNQDKLK